jgi:hypothetical protein
MKIPPLVMYLRIKEPEESGIRLWIPLFLLWLFVIFLLALFLPLVVLLALISVHVPEIRRVFIFAGIIYEIIFSLRELSVDVEGEHQVFILKFM